MSERSYHIGRTSCLSCDPDVNKNLSLAIACLGQKSEVMSKTGMFESFSDGSMTNKWTPSPPECLSTAVGGERGDGEFNLCHASIGKQFKHACLGHNLWLLPKLSTLARDRFLYTKLEVTVILSSPTALRPPTMLSLVGLPDNHFPKGNTVFIFRVICLLRGRSLYL